MVVGPVIHHEMRGGKERYRVNPRVLAAGEDGLSIAGCRGDDAGLVIGSNGSELWREENEDVSRKKGEYIALDWGVEESELAQAHVLGPGAVAEGDNLQAIDGEGRVVGEVDRKSVAGVWEEEVLERMRWRKRS